MKVLRVSASAFAPADVARTSAAVLAPENIPKWFQGAHGVQAADGYPNLGGTLDWAVGPGGRWRFHALVVEDGLPRKVAMRVRTPSGTSLVTHSFDPAPGGTRYTKTVEFTGGALNRLLVRTFLGRSVRREAAAAVRLVA